MISRCGIISCRLKQFQVCVRRYLQTPAVDLNSGHSLRWHEAVSEAKKATGFCDVSDQLKRLLNDEASIMATYLAKLTETEHPLVNLVRNFTRSDMRLQQLLITLVAKAINGSHKNISASQHSLAEITELIHAAHLIHFGVIDLKERDHNLEYGNKIGILCGDLLLAHSSVELAALQNQKVVSLIGQALAAMNTSAFVVSPQNNESMLDVWNNHIKLRNGTLLANAFQSVLLLAGDRLHLVDEVSLFGHSFALAWQAHVQLRDSLTDASFEPNLRTILAHLYPSEQAERAAELQDNYVRSALNTLDQFPRNQFTTALHTLTSALGS